MSAISVSRDGFLNNRLSVEQPRDGFRAGHDSVLLAAAVPAATGQTVLELGAGAGVVSLCLAARITGLSILGVEIDPALVDLANANAERNGLAEHVRCVTGDARSFEGGPFDHVVFNPPYNPASGQVSSSRARDRAMRDTDDALVAWTARAARLVRADGVITLILRTDRLDEWRASVSGAVTVKALLPREGEPPKRMIAWIHPSKRSGFKRLPPLTLHEDDGRPTHAADAILRHSAALAMI